MIATIRPACVTPAAGAVTCASTLPTATAIPSRSPVQAAACALSAPARAPSWAIAGLSLSAAKPRERRGSARAR